MKDSLLVWDALDERRPNSKIGVYKGGGKRKLTAGEITSRTVICLALIAWCCSVWYAVIQFVAAVAK
jgi:hypothetical protein